MVDRRAGLTFVLTGALLAGMCAGRGAEPYAQATPRSSVVSILLVGDVMLGRGVAPTAADHPDEMFADVRRAIQQADVAALNLESPLTRRAHASSNPNALEADPDTAHLLAAAGFDIAGLANNHAGDAGRASVLDTIAAVRASGLEAVGGGATVDQAWTPVTVEANGVRIAFLALDVSGQGVTATGDEPGIATWDRDLAHAAVLEARAGADIVVVGLHGGLEYWPGDDPQVGPIAREIATWGVDVVWGHGPHVPQPVSVIDPDDDGRPTVVATSLGNFLFDQIAGETGAGLMLHVLADRNGVVAYRVDRAEHRDLRVRMEASILPDGDAALVGGEWWTLARSVVAVDTSVTVAGFEYGTVVAASVGDLDRDGIAEALVGYTHAPRAPARESNMSPVSDGEGNTVHVGVFTDNLDPIWMARRIPHAIQDLQACDGAAAFAYATSDDAAGAGVWSEFGFVLAAELTGVTSIACADVDGNGSLEPIASRDRGANGGERANVETWAPR